VTASTPKGRLRRLKVLELLVRFPGESQCKLAERAGCTRSLIGHVLGELEDDGLITITGTQQRWRAELTLAGAEERRAYLVGLTPRRRA
jgi:DNA-binding MarR family transcriptional regulator